MKNKILQCICIFFFTILIGIYIYQDYGITWDETAQRSIGLSTYNYINYIDTFTYAYLKDNDYGVAFELVLIYIEDLFQLTDFREIFLSRHLVTHIFFLISNIYLFLLVLNIFKKYSYAYLAILFYLLSPRIYANSFFNSKDIPFMSMFVICLYYFHKFIIKKEIWYSILFGISLGLLINIRIMGILMYPVILIYILLDVFHDFHWKNILIKNSTALLISFLTLYFTWPYLWLEGDPVFSFIQAFKNMSKFRWEGSILSNGEFVMSTNLPISYIFIWFFSTIPLITSLFGIFGFFFFFKKYNFNFQAIFQSVGFRKHSFYFVCISGTVLSVLVLNSVLYDGWRQLFFIYPFFILISIYGIQNLVKKWKMVTQQLVIIFSALTLFFELQFMIYNHPFQYVYFNLLIPRSDQYIRKNFEFDYWGIGFYDALSYVVHNDSSNEIKVTVHMGPLFENILFLEKKYRKKVKFVQANEKPDYYFTNYRRHPLDYTEFSNLKPFYTIKVLNSDMITVWKLK